MRILIVLSVLTFAIVSVVGFHGVLRQTRQFRLGPRGLLSRCSGISRSHFMGRGFSLSMSTPQGDPQNPMVSETACIDLLEAIDYCEVTRVLQATSF